MYWDRDEGIGEEVLIIGSQNIENYKELRNKCRDNIPNKNPDGIGTAEFGKVVSWSSKEYNITTPRKIRTKILKILGMSKFGIA